MILRLLGALGAGFAMHLAFPDTNAWALAPVSLAALYVAVAGVSGRRAFLIGFVFGLSSTLPHIWWAYLATGPVPWLALALAVSAFVGLAVMLHARLAQTHLWQGRAWLHIASFSLLYVGAELLRSAWPFSGFPWARVAFAVTDASVARLAWLGGVPLVALAVVASGAMLGAAWLALRERRIVVSAALPLGAVLVFVVPLAIPLDARAESGQITVAWVQGNIPNRLLDSFSNPREVTGNHRDVTLAMMEDVTEPIDLLVWPENASDIDPRADAQTEETILEAVRAVGAPALIGSLDFSPENARYNMSLMVYPDGTYGDFYYKQEPVAFGEYVPMRDFARIFSDDVDRVRTDMIAGDEPAEITTPIASLGRNLTIGPIICFEVAYDYIPRQAVHEGAEFLAVQTNNATFGISAESTQQLAMSRLRAIETGRATLQVSTVGVSGVIMPDGRIVDRSELFTEAWGVAEVPLRTSLTPAMRWGGAFQVAVEVLAGGLALMALFRRWARVEDQ